ncbi:phenylalanine--tRNA ligase subunit beta [Xylophilus ampelinus]|uniref:Phenylalanine--tRNA ligase beta subunit n=1 Tax=Xylophilus ampelinus TaxID=54067 RepID=A0A318SLG6_9BURK|nr:phenylalanine--tRNA ligase subunit beta [Xylophilus ampelinus]MCS4509020.1 phenylalanine--tRNA ligase subunit beta [Xylophilus ampelinus]PYE79953.1 phenylalanyl-tRNA synthetase beta subunit [Xylophilus ampelinus]
MQFPESWLREFCNPPLDTQALADTLTMAGLEVEELQPVAPSFDKVVVGEIREAVQHPDADRLRVCKVDVGQPELLDIVCGAPNARVGIKVPCALVGAVLPPGADGKPFVIKVGKLRGVESHGMLCSARELKLSEDHGGLMELASDAPVGQDIRAWLNLDDTLFTLKLTPNLAHCLSVYGIAREVAALTGAPLKPLTFEPVAVTQDARLSVAVSAPDLCGRFSGRIVRNVNARAATPGWMVERLARCGQRSVSPLVDISNYVMFELGRPSHIFDLDKLNGGLDVRWARAGESLKLLNGTTVSLDDKVGVIADSAQVESLAGIMGGDATAVSDATTDIYIEAAFWYPKAVAGRSRRFNFSTDAGHRFERGVDPQQTVEHIEHLTRLVQSICGGDAGPVDDLQPSMPAPRTVAVRPARAAKVIGMPLSAEQCRDALASLGLPVDIRGDALAVTPPSWRFDLSIEEDLIEEIARIVGYENLPATPPLAPITPRLDAEARRSPFAVRRLMAAAGYQETINFSFVEERWETELAGNAAPIRLLNPIASHLSVMRSSLLGSLLQVLKFNLDRKASAMRAFELGRVFERDDTVQDSDATVQGYRQPMRIAGVAYGGNDALQWGRPERLVDFFDVKGDIEALLAPARPNFQPSRHPALHPGRSADVILDGVAIGVVGELHPRWRQSYGFAQVPVLFELALDAVLQRQVPAPVAVPKHQDVERDLAVVVQENVTHRQLFDAVRSVQDPLLQQVTVFDIYRPKPGKDGGVDTASMAETEKSVALRLVFNGGDEVLDDKRIDVSTQSVLNALQQRTAARLRA